jgi:death-on-curing protein
MSGAVRFLPAAIVAAIHDDQVRLYGGSYGVRDPAGLDAAIHAPQATFGGAYLNETIFDMAAAYGYSLCQNHPFIDGNKRTAGMAMLTFLKLNGYEPVASEVEYYEAVMAVATGRLDKAALAAWLRSAVAPAAPDSDSSGES